jgi:hypothetical protein
VSNRKHLSSLLSKETSNKALDEIEDRRMNAERMRGKFCGSNPPSRYIGLYDAVEVDDGRLDPFERSGFISDDQIPDDHEPYVEEDDEEYLVSGGLPPAPTKATPHGPRSSQNYAKSYYDRLPPLSCVTVIIKGRGQVPYKEVREQLRTQR